MFHQAHMNVCSETSLHLSEAVRKLQLEEIATIDLDKIDLCEFNLHEDVENSNLENCNLAQVMRNSYHPIWPYPETIHCLFRYSTSQKKHLN